MQLNVVENCSVLTFLLYLKEPETDRKNKQ